MLWDPSFATWSSLGVRINSQMMVMSADLQRGTDIFFGFGEGEQNQILEALPSLS